MAIIVENMNMPNTCTMCWISNICQDHIHDLTHIGYEKRLDDCPLHELVRCKDCKHFHDGIYNGEYWMECDEYRIALSSDDWFCADGERREDDEIH